MDEVADLLIDGILLRIFTNTCYSLVLPIEPIFLCHSLRNIARIQKAWIVMSILSNKNYLICNVMSPTEDLIYPASRLTSYPRSITSFLCIIVFILPTVYGYPCWMKKSSQQVICSSAPKEELAMDGSTASYAQYAPFLLAHRLIRRWLVAQKTLVNCAKAEPFLSERVLIHTLATPLLTPNPNAERMNGMKWAREEVKKNFCWSHPEQESSL